MQISPRASAAITASVSALSFLGAATPKMFPHYIPDMQAQDIITTAGLVSGLLTAAITPLHLFSNSDPGPWAPPDTPRVQAAIAADKAVAGPAGPRPVTALVLVAGLALKGAVQALAWGGVATFLASCAGGLPNSAQLEQEIQDVQKIAQDICAVIPQALDIGNLIAAGQITGAAAIANAICTAVTASGQTPPAAVAAKLQAHAAGAPMSRLLKWTPHSVNVGGTTIHFN